MGSILQKSESETIASNIMRIRARRGDSWELSWADYKREREKDGSFSMIEKPYFEEVIKLIPDAIGAISFAPSWARDARKAQSENVLDHPLSGPNRDKSTNMNLPSTEPEAVQSPTESPTELGASYCSPLYRPRGYRDDTFAWNDHVCIEGLFGVPDERRHGRLVQVRIGCGQFGSDVLFVRIASGELMTFENAMIRHANDRSFELNFYRRNGLEPPVITPQEPHPADRPGDTYSIGDEWPESGFIVEAPKQPQRAGSFAITISTPRPATEANVPDQATARK